MATALEANAAAFLAVAVLGVSVLMALLSGLSWRRLRHPRLLFVGAAFAVLALKGAVGSYAALQARPPDLTMGGLDFAVVLLLYASVAKR